MKLVKDCSVLGPIVTQRNFCDRHEIDIPVLMKDMKDIDVMTLFLVFEVTVPIGHFQVLLEALLEMLTEVMGKDQR